MLCLLPHFEGIVQDLRNNETDFAQRGNDNYILSLTSLVDVVMFNLCYWKDINPPVG